MLLPCMNGWRILTDETAQKINVAHPLVVPHEAVGPRNIHSLFLTLTKALDHIYWLNTSKVRHHINNSIIIPLHQNNIFIRIGVVKKRSFFWTVSEEAIGHFINRFSRIVSSVQNCFSFRSTSN